MRPALGRIAPPDDDHIRAYPLRLAAPAPTVCERQAPLRSDWRRFYNQGQTPRCVGFSTSEERSEATGRTFDANWLYDRCKERDGIPNEDGTFIRVAYDVLREVGPLPFGRAKPDKSLGVIRNEWATSVDQIRAAIASGRCVVVGTNWYDKMFIPRRRAHDVHFWLPDGDADLGPLAGGHAWLLNGVSDRYEAFTTPNSWGQSPRNWHAGDHGWPVTRAPYTLIERLLREDGEAVSVVD